MHYLQNVLAGGADMAASIHSSLLFGNHREGKHTVEKIEAECDSFLQYQAS